MKMIIKQGEERDPGDLPQFCQAQVHPGQEFVQTEKETDGNFPEPGALGEPFPVLQVAGFKHLGIENKAADDNNGQTDPEGPTGFAAVTGKDIPKNKGGQISRLPPLLQGLTAIGLNINFIRPIGVAAAL